MDMFITGIVMLLLSFGMIRWRRSFARWQQWERRRICKSLFGSRSNDSKPTPRPLDPLVETSRSLFDRFYRINFSERYLMVGSVAMGVYFGLGGLALILVSIKNSFHD